MTTTPATPQGADIEQAQSQEAKVEAFAERLFGLCTDGILTLMIDLGHRTGLFEALARGPATSPELAERANLSERYVREWLGGLVTGGVVLYDPVTRSYALPPEHAVCLTGEGSLNLAPMARAVSLLAKHVDGVARAFADGGGVPYEEFRPEFTDVMDGMSRGLFDGQLIEGIVPLTGLHDRLTAGVRVADIGCGTGHSTNLLARAYPASTFLGLDLAADALERARREAAEQALDNVTFEQVDLVLLPAEPAFDAVFAFDVIHDQADPATVLGRVLAALVDGGTFVMMDTRASSNLEDNVGNPVAPLLYGISTLHCMTVSLARGGAGLGTVWGEQLARRMLADAGFGHVDVHEVPDDPTNCLFVTRKTAG
jgi:SAM-dependent methyltransferase